LFRLALLSISNIDNGAEKSGSVFLILKELIYFLFPVHQFGWPL
jgi:hypothetical protein